MLFIGSQHQFRYNMVPKRQQAFTYPKDDQNLLSHIAYQDHKHLIVNTGKTLAMEDLK